MWLMLCSVGGSYYGNKVLMLDPVLFQDIDHGDVVDSNNALDVDTDVDEGSIALFQYSLKVIVFLGTPLALFHSTSSASAAIYSQETDHGKNDRDIRKMQMSTQETATGQDILGKTNGFV